ncbi:MAG: hypothetical protein VW166_05375 [Gammaproteobacteria bacterium]
MNDQFIQLQLKGVDDDINKLLLNFDLVLRVDDNGIPVSFAIENFAKREIATDYISLK